MPAVFKPHGVLLYEGNLRLFNCRCKQLLAEKNSPATQLRQFIFVVNGKSHLATTRLTL